MNFRQRFNKFFIGLGIGTLLCIILFGGRDWFGWAPNARVLKRLNETELQITERAKCLMDCREITEDDLYHLLETGSVQFDLSEVHQNPLIYIVDASRSESENYRMTFAAGDSTSTVTKVEWLEREVDCDC
ncbi:hypothetical protein [Halocola ammonii]